MAVEYIKHPFGGRKMRTPLIIGMDPGAERGYALVDPERMWRRRYEISAPEVLAVGTSLQSLLDAAPEAFRFSRPLWVAVEFQYAQRVSTGEISADSIIKLAFRAGYMLREASALPNVDEAFATTPQKWKPEVLPGGAALLKAVYCERLLRCLTPEEVTLVRAIEDADPDRLDDVLDAIGIAWSVAHASKFRGRLNTWRTNPERIIPLEKRTTRKSKFVRALLTTKEK